MKRTKRILLGLACFLLLAASWAAAITAKSAADRQRELLAEAASYTEDEIYILAVPILEEAAAYQDDFTLEAEEALKDAYLHLAGKGNYSRRYTELLEKQMARQDARPEVFLEAAQYYLEKNKTIDALAVLRDGIAKTGDEGLARLYEDNRYGYRTGRDFYDEAGDIYNGVSQVAREGRWGLASAGGLLLVPCRYDQISTFDGERAIVREEGVISAIDRNDNRIALFHGEAEGFGNYGENRLGLRAAEGWILANGAFGTGDALFEEVGMFSGGGAPAQMDGKWGVIGTDGETWLLEPSFDNIIRDDLGRCGDPEALFICRGEQVFLLADGQEIGPYEDARPFCGGWAAVKRDGRWGFIDREGTVRIDFRFEDARSFGQHLAAVRQDGLWGYVSLLGEMAIAPQFLEAKDFSGGSAPVRTGLGWQFITLLEYEEKGGLF